MGQAMDHPGTPAADERGLCSGPGTGGVCHWRQGPEGLRSEPARPRQQFEGQQDLIRPKSDAIVEIRATRAQAGHMSCEVRRMHGAETPLGPDALDADYGLSDL